MMEADANETSGELGSTLGGTLVGVSQYNQMPHSTFILNKIETDRQKKSQDTSLFKVLCKLIIMIHILFVGYFQIELNNIFPI